jgi:hypothetical protein
MNKRTVEGTLIVAATLLVTAVVVAAALPTHSVTSRSATAADSGIRDALLTNQPVAQAAAATCPYLAAMAAASSCPALEGRLSKSGSCPYLGGTMDSDVNRGSACPRGDADLPPTAKGKPTSPRSDIVVANALPYSVLFGSSGDEATSSS